MPSTSAAQHRAMEAAAHGHSNLGIPKKVGEEFVAADAVNGNAAGVLFVAKDGDILLMRRAADEANYGGWWGLPGGKAEDGEEPLAAARREVKEETGFDCTDRLMKAFDAVVTPNKMAFHTFACGVDEKFSPVMKDGEHTGAAWFSIDGLPAKTHPSVVRALQERLSLGEDMTPEDWTGLRDGFAKWTREEEREAEHAQDQAFALDEAIKLKPLEKHPLAFDRKQESGRRIDDDGHLHLERTHISKANVCEYLGSEINAAMDGEPGWQMLEPQRLYKLWRHPEELEKAAATFNNKPLLVVHKPVHAREPNKPLIAGTIGSTPIFEYPYLDNSLAIWDGEAIDDVENEVKKELSSAYQYRADMTPGKTPDGEAYDGVMRDIVGNHVALVKEGRAGPDVVVGDTMENVTMAKVKMTRTGAAVRSVIALHIAPRLAQDAKVDLRPILAKLTAKNYAAQKPTIIAGITAATKGKLAKDATLEDLTGLVDALEKAPIADGEEEMEVEDMPEETMDGESDIHQFLKGKLGEDDYMKACDMLKAGHAADAETEEEKKKREEEEAKKLAGDVEKAVEEKTKDMVDKKAMDQAIEAATKTERKRQQDIADAREDVRPLVGSLKGAFDSAEGVYQAALGVMGVADADKITGIPALKAVLKAQRPQGGQAPKPSLATDAKVEDDLAKRFPHAARIKVNAA
jgi:8-oxo-dGTP pyrophosphatase MutT (NUDIX family)